MLKHVRAALLATALPAALLAPCALPTEARAADPVFSPAQHDEIVRIVREALKGDPSILREAVVALQADDQARDSADAKAAIRDHWHALFSNPTDPEAGNPHGDVTLVEFYDPRCPYCRKMLPDIAALLRKDSGLRLVYKDIPVLGDASLLESKAILAAQKQGAYLRMQSAMMADPAQPTMELILDKARALGLDPARLSADMGGAWVTDKLKENLQLSRALKISGTPTFVVGETLVPGMVDAAQLQALVTNARKR